MTLILTPLLRERQFPIGVALRENQDYGKRTHFDSPEYPWSSPSEGFAHMSRILSVISTVRETEPHSGV